MCTISYSNNNYIFHRGNTSTGISAFPGLSRVQFVHFESTMEMGDQDNLKESFAQEALIRDYHVVLLVSCVASLIMGSPLACNVLWHLKVRF